MRGGVGSGFREDSFHYMNMWCWDNVNAWVWLAFGQNNRDRWMDWSRIWDTGYLDLSIHAACIYTYVYICDNNDQDRNLIFTYIIPASTNALLTHLPCPFRTTRIKPILTLETAPTHLNFILRHSNQNHT